MSIGEGIKQLLEARKRVILPGFGNLEVKESGGSVPAPGKRIDPPGPNIKFDNSYSKDDGVLAAAFAEAEGIDKTEAEQQVLELVDAIRFALDKGEPYPLSNAGIFRRDEEGKIHFQADPAWVLEPEQYGLDSMDLLELEDLPRDEEEPMIGGSEADSAPASDSAPVSDSAPASDSAPVSDEAPVSDAAPVSDEAPVSDAAPLSDSKLKADVVPAEPDAESVPGSQAEANLTPDLAAKKAKETLADTESGPAEIPSAKPVTRQAVNPEAKPAWQPIPQPTRKVHEPWKNKKTKKRSGLWRTIWIVTGILIVVLVVLIVVPAEKWDMAGKKNQPGEAVQVKQPAEAPVISDQSLAGEDNTAGEDHADETVNSEPVQEAAEETAPVEKSLPVQSDDFFIIAGSFSHLGNASELQDKLKAKGYAAEVMVTENRMYRVSVASYATQKEAEASLLRIQSEPGMEACWLLSNE